MEQENKYGLDFESIKIEEKDFIFGAGQIEERFGAQPVVREDGQYDYFLPKLEVQKFPWGESWYCPVYGTENCEQTLKKAKFGEFDEYTERFLGVLAGLKKNIGGNPNVVAEQWRKYGNLPYSFLPFEGVNSWEEFNSPNPMTPALIAEGKKYLEKWSFGHDWVLPGIVGTMKDAMKEALKYSPLGVGVQAWYLDSKTGYYYSPKGVNANHWVMCYGYEEGKYWKIFDHYDASKKKLAWDYDFPFVKRYTLGKQSFTPDSAADRGKKVYEEYKGKRIQRYEVAKGGHGEMYFVNANTIEYLGWGTNSKWVQEKLNFGLNDATKKGELKGISEQKFSDLQAYCSFQGIKIETSSDVKLIIK